jgi:hypothetical protein
MDADPLGHLVEGPARLDQGRSQPLVRQYRTSRQRNVPKRTNVSPPAIEASPFPPYRHPWPLKSGGQRVKEETR